MATNNGHVTDSPVDGDIDGDDDESWQKVGPKNHHVETNVVSVKKNSKDSLEYQHA